jgi:hypothetical protein
MESTLIDARVPARHFAEIPHEGREHYCLWIYHDVNLAGFTLFKAMAVYPTAKLEPCPLCPGHLILTIS